MTAARYFPLLGAGFRSNPFRALPDDQWAASAVLDPAVSIAFERTGAHLQVIGSMGAGKTTTLLGLGRLAQDAGARTTYLYIAEGQTRLESDIPSVGLLLLDEAQRLAAVELGRILDALAVQQRLDGSGDAPARWTSGPRQTRGLRLALATHTDLSSQFRARGLPLVTRSADALSLDGWRAFLDARLTAAALPGQPHATVADDAVRLLAARFGADRRAAVAFLYEVFQALRTPAVVDAAWIRRGLVDAGHE